MGQKPAFPPHGHGMEGVAQAGIEQVAEEYRAANQGVAEVHQAEDADADTQNLRQIVVFFRKEGQRQQEHARQVQSPDGSEAGNVLAQDSSIKERCP